MKFIKILEPSNIEKASIYAISNHSYFSLTNTPYPPHIMGSAVDIYHKYPYMCFEKGIVKKILRIPTPMYRYDAAKYDYVILIDLGSVTGKILHVKPHVKLGDKLYLGDYIGDYIISGYFRPWSSKHMHVEVRPKTNELGVSNGYFLKPSNELLRLINALPCTHSNEFHIMSISKSYLWIKPVDEGYFCVNLDENEEFILDAGFPHYGYGGLLSKYDIKENLLNQDSPLFVQSHVGVIGEVINYRSRRALIKFTSIPKMRFKNKDLPILGIGTYVLKNQLKVILNSSIRDVVKGSIITLRVVRVNNIPINKYLNKSFTAL